MAGLSDFTKHDPGAPVDLETRLELRRVANLFLVSSATLVVLLLEVGARAREGTLVPPVAYAVAGLAFLLGWAATYVYGLYVTFKARRRIWFALCAFPLSCVPAALAYSWIRRREVERMVLEDAQPAQPRRPAGRRP